MRRIMVITLIVLLLVPAIPAFADTSDISMDRIPADCMNGTQNASIKADGYYTWKVYSISTYSYYYDSWRDGPSGLGPATLTLSNSNASSISVTNTISGSYTNVATISAALGVTINVSEGHSVSYSISIPSGSRRQIIYRPYMRVYKVVQRQYFVDHGTESYTGQSKTCYVNVFNNWDYSWRSL